VDDGGYVVVACKSVRLMTLKFNSNCSMKYMSSPGPSKGFEVPRGGGIL
jgi:hypothetical protein